MCGDEAVIIKSDKDSERVNRNEWIRKFETDDC